MLSLTQRADKLTKLSTYKSGFDHMLPRAASASNESECNVYALSIHRDQPLLI